MINEKVLLGYPLNFQDKIWIYPPKISEVVGNDKIFIYLEILTKSQEEVEDILVESKSDMEFIPTPLEFLLSNCYHNSEICELTKEAFQYFTHQSITILYEAKAIYLGDINDLGNINSLDDLTILNEDNFFDFQNTIRISMGNKKIDPPNPNEDPRVKRIKAKARYRDKIKAKSGQGISLGTNLAAICCMGFGINPLNIGELSYASVRYLTEMYQNKEEYSLDISSLLAGADSNKIKPKYWIRNLE